MTDEPPALPPEPTQSPLFHAEQAERYSRQELIADYQHRYGCRLVVVIDAIFPYSITLFEELIYDANPNEPMHLLLHTPGGDGETAVRLVRAAQSRCSRLTVIVPDQAKSAGTLLCLGAHEIMMGPTSDLGPVDAQLPVSEKRLESAKNIIAAVEAAEAAVKATPDSYPIHASLLANVDALLVQNARAAMARSEELMKDALGSNTDRAEEEVANLADALKMEVDRHSDEPRHGVRPGRSVRRRPAGGEARSDRRTVAEAMAAMGEILRYRSALV